jgi:hypothetical protein
MSKKVGSTRSNKKIGEDVAEERVNKKAREDIKRGVRSGKEMYNKTVEEIAQSGRLLPSKGRSTDVHHIPRRVGKPANSVGVNKKKEKVKSVGKK